MVFAEVVADGLQLEHSPEFSADYGIAIAAVAQNVSALKFVHKDIRGNVCIVRCFMMEDYTALALYLQNLLDTDNTALAILRHQPVALKLLSRRLRSNHSIVIAAVTVNARTFEFAGRRVRRNAKFIWRVLTTVPITEGRLLDWALEPARTDPRLISAQDDALVTRVMSGFSSSTGHAARQHLEDLLEKERGPVMQWLLDQVYLLLESLHSLLSPFALQRVPPSQHTPMMTDKFQFIADNLMLTIELFKIYSPERFQDTVETGLHMLPVSAVHRVAQALIDYAKRGEHGLWKWTEFWLWDWEYSDLLRESVCEFLKAITEPEL